MDVKNRTADLAAKPLRLLVVEDSPQDAEIAVREIRRGGFDVTWKRLETAETMRAALREKTWDIILCDYQMPKFNGIAAIALLKETGIDIPMIIVSGAIGEETAVECMRSGANDYVMKGNLSRLVPAVKRELKEAESRRERKRVELLARQRMKELQALYCLAEMAQREGITLEELYKEFTNILPKSWRYEEIACARLVIGGSEFRTENFAESPWMQSAPIKVNREVVGRIEVGYLEERQGEGPFLKEEKQLIDAVAEQLGRITERKKAADKLSESEQKFRTYIEQAPLAVFVSDLEGRFLDCNPKTADMLGYESTALKKMSLTNIYAEEDRAAIQQALETLRQSGYVEGEFRIMRKDGTSVWILLNISLIQGTLALGYCTDITQRKMSEEVIANLSRHNALILSSTAEGILGVDLQGNHTFINEAAAKILGYEAEELLGRPSHSIWHHTKPDGSPYPREECPILGTIREGNVHRNSTEVFWRKDGTCFPVEYASTPIYEKGQIEGAVVTFMDITDRRRAEEALRESEILFRSYLENAPDGVYMNDLEGNFLYGNRKCEEIIGYRREEVIGKNFLELNLLPEKSLNKAAQLLQANMEGRSTGPDEVDLIRKDGRLIPVEINTNVVQRMDQKIVLSFARDISERKRANEIQRESDKKYRDIYNNSIEGIYQTTPQGRYIIVNPAFARMFGYDSPADLIQSVNITGQQIDVNPQEREQLQHLLTQNGSVENFEAQAYRRDGSKFWIKINAHTVMDAEGNVLYHEGTAEDITHRKDSEDRIKKEVGRTKLLLELYLMAPKMADKELYDYVLEKAVNLTDSKIGFFHQVADGGKTIILTTWNAEALKSCTAAYDTHYPLEQAGNWVDCVRYKKPIIYNDFPNAPNQKGLPEGHAPIKRFMSIPVMDRDVRLIFGVGNKDKEYDHHDMAQLQLVANELYKIIIARKAENDLKQSFNSLQASLAGAVQAMATVVESRDPYTAGHQRRVAGLAHAIASEMRLPIHQMDGLRMAAIIHDLGKMAVPAEILSKPTKLKKSEFELIKDHPQAGYEILKDIAFPWPIARIVMEHHEKMDGSGYPNGSVGENTLLESKILMVADVVEAMASHRPYRPALGIDAALKEIEMNKGTHYDVTVVEACLSLFREKGFQLEGT